MRTEEELERIAFREKLTAEEDDRLVACFVQRAEQEPDRRKKAEHLKQAAFFGCRSFDKGHRDRGSLAGYVKLLAEVQRLDPSDSFRRKLAAMKSALGGKGGAAGSLRKLAHAGTAGSREVLADDALLDDIEEQLEITLPPSYRTYLKKYAHRQIGTYEPFTAADLVSEAEDAWGSELEPELLPFLEDNGDYFCFDMSTEEEEPPVVFRPHDGTSDEIWANFGAWVEECWLGELNA